MLWYGHGSAVAGHPAYDVPQYQDVARRCKWDEGCSSGAAGGPDDPPRAPLQLWVADTSTGQARRLLGPEHGLNSVINE